MFKAKHVFLALAIFFLTLLLLRPQPTQAQVSCSLDQVFAACGGTIGDFSCISPTVTPTPVAVNPWIRVKSSSFSANTPGSLDNFSIPTGADARRTFNDGDSDDSNEPYFLFGDSGNNPAVSAGVLTAPSVGTGLAGRETESDLVINNYERKKDFTPAKFLDYASARKRINRISSLNDMVKERVNIIEAPPTGAVITDFCATGDNFDAAAFMKTSNDDRGPYVLVVKGDLTISTDINYKKAGQAMTCVPNLETSDDEDDYNPIPLTLVVTGDLRITSKDSTHHVNQINAVVMAENVYVEPVIGGQDQLGLKIKGNLIVQDTFENTRFRTESRRPAIFIVQDPGMYISLLPYFSTAEYDWKQLK